MFLDKSNILANVGYFLERMEDKRFLFNADTKLDLNLFGESTETELVELYISSAPRRYDDRIMLISKVDFNEEHDVDCLSHFSTYECARIWKVVQDTYEKDEYKIIYNHLRNNDADFDEVNMFEYDEVSVSVTWGDWKHSHRYLTYLMEKIGYTQIDEELTEEDGSDTYSSIHYFRKNR